jgi:4-amino-4-deoxy-L-arabinose transferase-like glycosyltransferase
MDGLSTEGQVIMRRGWACLLAAGFASLFAIALWFRVSSLDAFPWHNADESYYGLQTVKLLRGEPFALRTASGNVLNPYMVILLGLLHQVGTPSIWVLRVPAVFCGVLAVVATYVLMRRALDRTTALIAAALLAALPSTVYHSRVGLEQSQMPLIGVIVLACALRGNGLGLLLSFLASLLVHPTNAFLLPIAMPVYLVQLYRKSEGVPLRRGRLLIGVLVVSVVGLIVLSALLLRHPVARLMIMRRPPMSWGRFLAGYERLLFFLYHVPSPAAIRLHRWLFWSATLLFLGVATARLARERGWERLALLVGLIVSLTSFHVVAGPMLFSTFATERYGVVFLVPTVLAFACLVRSLAPNPLPEALRSTLARGPLTVALVIGLALLFSFKLNYLDPTTKQLRESLWTITSDGADEYERALSLIETEQRHNGASPAPGALVDSDRKAAVPVIAHDFWVYMPLAYLAASSQDMFVKELVTADGLGSHSPLEYYLMKETELREQLRSGAYIITRPGSTLVPFVPGTVENLVRSWYPAESVQCWVVPDSGGHPQLTVYRINDAPAPATAIRQGPADDGRPLRR